MKLRTVLIGIQVISIVATAVGVYAGGKIYQAYCEKRS